MLWIDTDCFLRVYFIISLKIFFIILSYFVFGQISCFFDFFEDFFVFAYTNKCIK